MSDEETEDIDVLWKYFNGLMAATCLNCGLPSLDEKICIPCGATNPKNYSTCNGCGRSL